MKLKLGKTDKRVIWMIASSYRGYVTSDLLRGIRELNSVRKLVDQGILICHVSDSKKIVIATEYLIDVHPQNVLTGDYVIGWGWVEHSKGNWISFDEKNRYGLTYSDLVGRQKLDDDFLKLVAE